MRRSSAFVFLAFLALVPQSARADQPGSTVVLVNGIPFKELLDQAEAQKDKARRELQRFRPVWDEKSKEIVCGKRGPDGRPLLDKKGRIATGYNDITVVELMETKDGACGKIPPGSVLQDRDLRGFHLEYSKLLQAFWSGSVLDGAHLEGADLRGGHGLDGVSAKGVELDARTRLPSELAPWWPMVKEAVRVKMPAGQLPR